MYIIICMTCLRPFYFCSLCYFLLVWLSVQQMWAAVFRLFQNVALPRGLFHADLLWNIYFRHAKGARLSCKSVWCHSEYMTPVLIGICCLTWIISLCKFLFLSFFTCFVKTILPLQISFCTRINQVHMAEKYCISVTPLLKLIQSESVHTGFYI